MKRLFAIVVAPLIVCSILASPAIAEVKRFASGEPVNLQPDMAYILVRTFNRDEGGLRGTALFAPIYFRELSDGELEAAKQLSVSDPDHWKEKAEPNVAEPFADKPYAVQGNEEYLLIGVKPGTYVLGGLAVTNWASVSEGLVISSLCMGTVSFEAKAGVITDLGTIVHAMNNQPTDIPELKNVVIGYSIDGGIGENVALRPTAMDVLPSLANLARVPAVLKAVGKMPDYLQAHPDRLAPLPGVLDYDEDGNVMNLKSSK